MTKDNQEMAAIHQERFPFRSGRPKRLQHKSPPAHVPDIPCEVTPEEIKSLLKQLPDSKAPGPDNIPNEVLTAIGPEIAKHLSVAITKCLERGGILIFCNSQ